MALVLGHELLLLRWRVAAPKFYVDLIYSLTRISTLTGSEGHLEREESGQKGPKKEGAKKMENESAIPTAGGQRLGEEHWGESKIVPENPKPQEGEGVSSGSGQPDGERQEQERKKTCGIY